MTGITKRKLVGTIVAVCVLMVGAFGSAKAAQAFFLGSSGSLIFDGTVDTVGTSSFSAFTSGTSPITIGVTGSTVFSGAGNLSGLKTGDVVKVIAHRQGSNIVGQIIRLENNVSGYGSGGAQVLVSRGTVVSASGNRLVVSTNGVDVTFQITTATRFFNTTFAGLAAGQSVVVTGQDIGSGGFAAKDVFR